MRNVVIHLLLTLNVVAMPAMAADNLLTNGSFEEAGDRGLAKGWRLSADVGDAPTVARMSDEAGHSGAFVRLSRTSDGQADLRPATQLARNAAILFVWMHHLPIQTRQDVPRRGSGWPRAVWSEGSTHPSRGRRWCGRNR